MQGRPTQEANPTGSGGPLVIIGGAEDRSGESPILRRLISLTQRADPRIAVLTAANATPDKPWHRYDEAFRRLGLHAHEHLRMPEDSSEAALADLASRMARADAILMSGGDQRRLMSRIGGTAVERAILDAYARGICIAGSSAGAAAMSRRMLADGQLQAGLGLLHNIVIDQHFSQRRRLPRLIAAVAGQPELIGVGVDEDTALVIMPDGEMEVVGSGRVVFVDGRRATCSQGEGDAEALMCLPGVEVMALAAGRHRLPAEWGVASRHRL